MKKNIPIELAMNWISDSNIRMREDDQWSEGGLCQGYNWKEHVYPFIYCEITGYGISSYVNYHRWTGESKYLDMAQRSAEFLINLQKLVNQDEVYGAIPHSLSIPGLIAINRYFSFDSAMCLQGLLDLYSVLPTEALLRAAREIGNWLVSKMQRRDGSFAAVINFENDVMNDTSDEIFGDGGCLHAKHSIGLLKLGKLTGDDRYFQSAKLVCDWVLRLQNNDGSIRTSNLSPQVVSHTCCYAIEGLLFAQEYLKEKRYLDAGRKAARWLIKAQNKDGSLNIAYKRDWRRMGRRITEIVFPRKVSDATAQALRIWLMLYYLDGERAYLEASRNAAQFLLRMQITSTSDVNAFGGFLFWPGHPIMFTWSTMFAVHSLYALENLDRSNGYQRLIDELF